MEQKIIFREMLSEVKALADSRNNRLTTKEIDDFFSNTHLSREQMELVYEYLMSQKIQVLGYEGGNGQIFSETGQEVARASEGSCRQDEGSPEADKISVIREEARRGDPDSAEDDGFRSMELYLKEVEQISRLSASEELELFGKAADGDGQARRKLAELYLPMVCELAADYEGTDCPAEDLIQEGNVGLLLAVESMEPQENLAAYQACLMNAVNQYMQDALQEQKDIREMGDHIASRVNHLNEAIHNLEEELEHRVSVEELSAYLEMPAEEIRDILKMAGDEIKIEGYENQ